MKSATLQRKKIKTARLSIISNTFLIIIKLAVGILSGSVSIISEAIHSLMDLMAAIIAFFSVKISALPPDKKHPYGHGKFENISGVIEAILIFIAAGWIIFEAIEKLLKPTTPNFLGIGAIVMAISAGVNFWVSRRLYKVAKETDSVALEADALHLKTDVYTSLGVAIGLILIWVSGLIWNKAIVLIDPIIAILVALLILKESYVLLKKAYAPLLDTPLPDDEILIIENTIKQQITPEMGYHMLRTRKAGHIRYVDLHLEVPGNLSVIDSHNLCDIIEKEIISKLNHIEVYIHIEPTPPKDGDS
ncbi:MAG: cation diffusion facilitator family transporter [Bacteroidota bacterium]